MQGYDEKNELLLPPRAAGESLPEELQEYYVDYCTQLAEKGTFTKELRLCVRQCMSPHLLKFHTPVFSPAAKGSRG